MKAKSGFALALKQEKCMRMNRLSTGAVVRSSEYVKILGLTEPVHFTHQQFVDKIHPEDRPKYLAAIARLTPENPTNEVTYRALASDGFVWLKSNGRGFFDGEGKLLRVIGMVADVTEHKRGEEALAGMTRKLIEAQEQERARIGRELHDDINQRLAMLAVELEQLETILLSAAEPCARTPKTGGRNLQRRAGPVARLALLKIGISGCCCGDEKLVQRVRRTSRNGDRLQN